MEVDDTKPIADTDGAPEGQPPLALGPTLRRAWLGYQARLDRAMSDVGFDERRFPDGRVLRLCVGPTGSTISNIGRELGITRQGAGKVVGHLHDRGIRSPADSPTSGREKEVTLTPLEGPNTSRLNAKPSGPSSVICARNWERSRSVPSTGCSNISMPVERSA